MFGKARHIALITFAAVCGIFSQGFAQDLLYSDMFALGDVQLLGGPLKDRQDLNVETLLSYDVDKLIAPFYNGNHPQKRSMLSTVITFASRQQQKTLMLIFQK